MASKSCILVALATLVSIATGYSGKVLLVSFDGFRWDYLNNIGPLANFDRMAEEGVKVPYMNNTFSTVTFPNHYSIATGLYQEAHGIVLNNMYDPELDAWFHKGTSSKPGLHWFDGGEPLWITATRQGKKSGVHFWVGGDHIIRGLRPDVHVAFNFTYTWQDQVSDVVRWFATDNVDVVALYNNRPDHEGHHHGPYSEQTNMSVINTDANLGYLLDQLAQEDLLDSINLIVTSDHGMAKVDYGRVLDLHQYIDRAWYSQAVFAESICMILPKVGYEDKIYDKLHNQHGHMHVYHKHELPERWHYKNNPRILPLVITMDVGWQCVENKSDEWWRTADGAHGYDNDLMEMKPIFLARGPAFKKGYLAKGGSMSCLDIYPLVCHILGIAARPHNGSMDHVADLLATEAEWIASGATSSVFDIVHISSIWTAAAWAILISQLHAVDLGNRLLIRL